MKGWAALLLFMALMPGAARAHIVSESNSVWEIDGGNVDLIYTIPDLEAHGIPTLEEYVGEYCRLTGRAGLPDLNWYFAYNAFRLAGIIQGIVGRVRDGTANSPQAAAMEARVPLLGEAAWGFAVKAGA